MSVAATGNWRWQVSFVLLTATLLSYLDRQALSVVAIRVRQDLSLDNEQLGLLLSAFFWSYSLMHIAIGFVLDRYNIRVTYPLFVGLWSLAQIGCGMATGFAGLFTGRLFLGAFETAGQTGAARILARVLPPEERALGNGIMMSGGSIGAMIAPPLMIWLANSYGWRAGLIALGIAGAAWSAAFFLWFKPPGLVARQVVEPLERQAGDRWAAILRDGRFWSCVAGATFTIPILHVVSAWVPTYFAQHWGLPLAAALGGYLFIIYAGLDVGFVGGGVLVRYWSKSGLSTSLARKRVLTIAMILMLCALLVPAATSPWMAVGLVFLMNVGRACWGAIFLAFNQEIAPARVAMVAGVFGCLGSLSGAILVWLIGVISKSQGFAVPFWMLGVLAVLGTIPVLWAQWQD